MTDTNNPPEDQRHNPFESPRAAGSGDAETEFANASHLASFISMYLMLVGAFLCGHLSFLAPVYIGLGFMLLTLRNGYRLATVAVLAVHLLVMLCLTAYANIVASTSFTHGFGPWLFGGWHDDSTPLWMFNLWIAVELLLLAIPLVVLLLPGVAAYFRSVGLSVATPETDHEEDRVDTTPEK